MTFLSGVQDLARECDLANEPADTTTQTGQHKRLVNWYKQAYVEIQNRTDWRWLRHGFTVDTVADDDTYASGDVTDTTSSSTIDRFGRWHLQSFDNPPKAYLTASGVGAQYYLSFVPWEWFSQIYRFGTLNSGAPAHISIDPQNNIVVGPKPSAVYTITGEYYRSPQVLAADDDVPEMPSQYHYLIVYEAMMKYGFDSSAQEVIARAEREGRRMMRQLERNQGPVIHAAGPLV